MWSKGQRAGLIYGWVIIGLEQVISIVGFVCFSWVRYYKLFYFPSARNGCHGNKSFKKKVGSKYPPEFPPAPFPNHPIKSYKDGFCSKFWSNGMATNKKRTIFHWGGIKFQISGGGACVAVGKVPVPNREGRWGWWRSLCWGQAYLRSRQADSYRDQEEEMTD